MRNATFKKHAIHSMGSYLNSWAYYLSTHVLIASILMLLVAAATIALPKAIVALLILTTSLTYGFWLVIRLAKLVFSHVDEISRFDDIGERSS